MKRKIPKTFSLDVEVLEKLKIYCNENYISQSAIVSDAVEKILKEKAESTTK